MVALFIALTIIVFLTADYVVQRLEMRKAPIPEGGGARGSAVAPSAAPARPDGPAARIPRLDDAPRGLFFSPEHTWARLEPSGTLVFGADRLAALLLGSPSSVSLVAEGTRVKKGDILATIRRGVREIALRSPADGTVASVNEEVAGAPDAVRNDPYRSGWLCRLEPDRISPIVTSLFVGEEARAWMRDELGRLRDALAAAGARARSRGALAEAAVTLPDGGPPREGAGDALDDGAWRALTAAFFGADAPKTRAQG